MPGSSRWTTHGRKSPSPSDGGAGGATFEPEEGSFHDPAHRHRNVDTHRLAYRSTPHPRKQRRTVDASEDSQQPAGPFPHHEPRGTRRGTASPGSRQRHSSVSEVPQPAGSLLGPADGRPRGHAAAHDAGPRRPSLVRASPQAAVL